MRLCHIAASAPLLEQPELPEDIQHLIEEFSKLFQEPTELPPRRQCNHHIPLAPGAPPVAVRQYRYKPVLKDEIEKQVSKMLQSGMVQSSSSAFSSPMLLVHKKDGT